MFYNCLYGDVGQCLHSTTVCMVMLESVYVLQQSVW